MFPVALIAAALAPTPGLPEYVIEPPDVLRINAPGLPVVDETPSRVTDVYAVRPDGTVYLGRHGSVSVAGLTVARAGEAVRVTLGGRVGVRVELVSGLSKRVYVVTGDPERVTPLPCTGTETVLDALAAAGKLPVGKSNVWVARRTPHAGRPEQVLPVDYVGITQDGVTTTNYQLLPGDRVYVKPAAK